MAVKTKEQIIADANALIPDNTEQLVSPADIRVRIIDIADSVAFNATLPLLANVATSGSYTDLINRPVFANVALSGSYNDLSNKPVFSNVATTGQYTDLINRPTFATVATSGSYDDLTNKPAFGALATQNTVSVSQITIANTSTGVVLGRTSGGGATTTLPISPIAQAATIAYRGTGGVLGVGSPTADEHAVPRSWMNGNVVMANTAQGLTYKQQSFARSNIGTDALTTYRNKFINGRLDFWQRAQSQTTSGYKSSDRFAVGLNGTGTAVTWSRQAFPMGDTSIPGNTESYGRMVITNGGDAVNGVVNIFHSIENVRTCDGKWVTVTFYARNPSTTTVLKMALSCYQIFGTTGTPSPRTDTPVGVVTLPADNTWHRYDVVFQVPSVSGKTRTAGEDMVGVEFIMSAGSSITRAQGIGIQTGTFDLARLSLVEGDATNEEDPFFERPYSLEQLLCWRYYRVIRVQWSGMCTSGAGYWARDTLYPPMRTVPTGTMTVTSQVGFNTSGSFAVSGETVVVNVVCNSTINNGEYTVDLKLDAEI